MSIPIYLDIYHQIPLFLSIYIIIIIIIIIIDGYPSIDAYIYIALYSPFMNPTTIG